jgi:hypothetical protein
MQICVCGWHYRRPFYESLCTVSSRFDITVVANRRGDALGLPTLERENVGLDWGAFSHFVDHAWDGEERVLFLHDDTKVEPACWDEIGAVAYDQAFIFRDEAEFEQAYSHGRAHVASGRLLTLVRDHGGIWFDSGNNGFIAEGSSWSEVPPLGCLDHNAAIRAYTALVERIGAENGDLVVGRTVYSQSIHLGRRGRLPSASLPG